VAQFVDPRADADRWAARFGALRRATEARNAAIAGDLDTAVLLMERAMRLDWNDHFASQTAIAYLQLNRPREALGVLRTLTDTAGKSSDALWLEGDAYAQLGEQSLAEHQWSESLDLRGSRVAHERLAGTERRPEQAQHHRARALYFAALENLQTGDIEEAMPRLEASLKLDPRQSMAWYLLGEARRIEGHADAARLAYRQSLDLRPENGRAQEALDALDSSPKDRGSSSKRGSGGDPVSSSASPP
jgi:Tfp pilus assembly protein PilF